MAAPVVAATVMTAPSPAVLSRLPLSVVLANENFVSLNNVSQSPAPVFTSPPSDVHVFVPPLSFRMSVPVAKEFPLFVTWALNEANVPAPPLAKATSPMAPNSIRYLLILVLDITHPLLYLGAVPGEPGLLQSESEPEVVQAEGRMNLEKPSSGVDPQCQSMSRNQNRSNRNGFSR